VGAQQGAVLAVGGSAGGIEALVDLVSGLPVDLPASVLVTIHISASARSQLPQILSRSGPLPAVHARHGAPLVAGRIHVAPPGFHLVLDSGLTLLSAGPAVNHHRPSVDVMFASAARAAGARVVAAVLSGVLDDGAVGAALVAQAGGRVLVQRPEEAVFAGMPQAALRAAPGARSVATAELAGVAARLLEDGDSDGRPVPAVKGPEVPEMSMADSDDTAFLAPQESGLTRLTCPDCHGVLAQVDLPRISYYRCHVGHQWAPQTLAAAQTDHTESQLWTAVALLEEQATLGRHLAGTTGPGESAAHRRSAERAAGLARSLRTHLQPPEDDDLALGPATPP
jgi:two-component system, chemotaxis family, protein-glutamate methylesterase/glutaminase